jgi:flagellin-specific chaperone FliS
MRKLYLFALLLTLLLAACSTGKRALERGDYYESVTKAVNRLRATPNNKKAREAITQAYPMLLNYNLDKIQRVKLSNDPYRWEEIAGLYKQLNWAYDEIMRAPAASRLIPDLQNFRSEYEGALSEASEARIQLGETELDKSLMINDREAAKTAYRHFKKAYELQPANREAEARMLEAREAATVHVLIEPIPVSRRYEISNEFFQNRVQEYVRRANLSEFVRFYTIAELEARQQTADHLIRMSFDDFEVGKSRVKETVEDRERDSVVVGEVDVQEGEAMVKKEVYSTVKAKVHLFEKELISRGLLDFKIVDLNDQAILRQKKFPGSYTWMAHWGYFNGDERALTEEDQKWIENTREVPDPGHQTLFSAFANPIYGQVEAYLKGFYRNY